ncbi:hypothetical protein KIN20_024748 [Parelaphostrongylus tenuis]|uniref:G-protein coupled receptors family 1 profile domain-containing protein n=1 Tax=Parelaphostrongylus tenuis TaxID=148309 RepID=A0AAD5MYP3_PARTN|nr:hypothetical protein KIN20_024748 [Parelaphostrongylus tenuis]
MEPFLSMPLSTIGTISIVFRWIEVAVQMQGIVFAILFITIISRIHSIHTNLRIVISSFLISCLIAAIVRTISVIQELYIPLELLVPDVRTLLTLLRISAVYAAGFHPLLVAFERLLAVIRSRTYEKETNVVLLLILIILVWTFSYFVMFLPQFTAVSSMSVCLSFFPIYFFITTLIAYIRHSNLELWRRNRGVLQFSHSYQVRDNVETARWLFRFMTIFSILILTGWTSLIIHIYLLEKHSALIVIKSVGFVFDISIALLTTATTFVLYYYNNKVNIAVKRFRLHHVNVRSNNIVGLEGNQLTFNTKEEGVNYFQQYQMAWS